MMVTKDDAMEFIVELEDMMKVLELRLDEKVSTAMSDRYFAIKKYIRNSENIIVKAKT